MGRLTQAIDQTLLRTWDATARFISRWSSPRIMKTPCFKRSVSVGFTVDSPIVWVVSRHEAVKVAPNKYFLRQTDTRFMRYWEFPGSTSKERMATLTMADNGQDLKLYSLKSAYRALRKWERQMAAQKGTHPLPVRLFGWAEIPNFRRIFGHNHTPNAAPA